MSVPPSILPSAPRSRNHTKDHPGGHRARDQSSNLTLIPSSSTVTSLATASTSVATTSTSLATASTLVQRIEGMPDSGYVGSSESGQLEPKQSLCSPMHSKRSLSAGMLKKIISDELAGKGLPRVTSVEDVMMRDKTVQLPIAGYTGSQQQHGVGEEGGTRKRKKSEKSKAGSDIQSRESSRKSSTAELPFWESELVPLLQEMESVPYEEVHHLRTLCDSLSACLEKHGLLGRTGGVGGTKRRSTVLRTVFKLLDHKDPLVLLKVAKIIIAVSYSCCCVVLSVAIAAAVVVDVLCKSRNCKLSSRLLAACSTMLVNTSVC